MNFFFFLVFLVWKTPKVKIDFFFNSGEILDKNMQMYQFDTENKFLKYFNSRKRFYEFHLWLALNHFIFQSWWIVLQDFNF